ncbi:ABC transporter permease subunit [Roseococcus sp. SDR]|uniref:ABC transporter permease n=1 Tax=Roseococcus sp. SDR TaxID=2835532 RepID=UPI001BCD7BA2|nr:ABC transporter permease subunit [Roseococcus sp. SDR]MBS7792272.1 ABC transporter permease [Roseococcus sp. SDR]MBV1847586.1 ABC transporter permease subunit [Roseococcus sp. SDR]
MRFLALVLPGLALLGPWLAPFDPLDQDLLALNQPPGAVHWLGTDHLGRDVLSRLLAGAGTTLAVAALGTALALLLGGLAGLILSGLGRGAEWLGFAVVDTLRGLPPLLLGLVALAAMGPGLAPLVLALALSYAPLFAHVARTARRREEAADYVLAAVVSGAGPWRVLLRHILPNVAGPLVTLAAITLPRCVVTESVLSFLGLGAAPDAPTWGRMAADAARLAEAAPHALLVPVTAIALATAAAAALGNAVRRQVDPRRA